jgi:hypothetical protein
MSEGALFTDHRARLLEFLQKLGIQRGGLQSTPTYSHITADVDGNTFYFSTNLFSPYIYAAFAPNRVPLHTSHTIVDVTQKEREDLKKELREFITKLPAKPRPKK